MPNVLVLIVHLLTVILGTGQIAAIAVLVGVPVVSTKVLSKLVSLLAWSVLIVFLTGIYLVFVANDHPERHWWMRLVVLLTVLLGYLSGASARLLKQASDPIQPDLLKRLRAWVWTMTAATAAVVVLISAKPG